MLDTLMKGDLKEVAESLIYSEQVEKLLITGSENLMGKSILYVSFI